MAGNNIEEVEGSATADAKTNSASEVPPEFLIKHPLQNTWSLWFYDNDRNKTWEENLIELTTFDTVEDFWRLYHHIKLPSELRQGHDYAVFKQGIRPMWEDDANKMGGRWLISLEKKQRNSDLDRFWLDVPDLATYVDHEAHQVAMRKRRQPEQDSDIRHELKEFRKDIMSLLTDFTIAQNEKLLAMREDIRSEIRDQLRIVTSLSESVMENIRPPAIVVRFTQRRRKNELLAAVRARRGLTTSDIGLPGPAAAVYVGDHLTPVNKLLLKQARQLKLEHNYSYLWVLLLIGENFENPDEICGAVVNVRPKLDKIGIWTADASRQQATVEIGRKLKDQLGIHGKIGFQVHRDTMVKHSSATKNLYTV
ncbi:hypothetical protein MSG28_007771 [Choristoneura fumiferana]|uniref:Uncharacterized protein n=2 Tax=Choristoneura fumiferana TaxID=7141 RepID=A0ACC0JYK3_CHOFU|nr:hypothetical protein MSG28_007771 [Choristoneura fumiferana]KAI8429267.1 hypothetical protein MSG28_007771 [Choristoneura fumiferana]